MLINAKGKACPEPVLMTKAALDRITEGVLTVIVDNSASAVNVKNFSEAQGCCCEIKEENGDYKIEVVKGYACSTAQEAKAEKLNVVLHISGESMGSEDLVLGKLLMQGFVCNLKNITVKPVTVILVNTSVKMLTDNETTIAAFKELEEAGIEILACGTCLNHFGLTDSLKAGKIADAHTVMEKMFSAERLVRM
jgi:selenium metabolism protein YedF